MQGNPIVTVIVPSYNHDKFIKTCIESIIALDYIDFELIVIDDGSRDHSREILDELNNQYNFRLIFQENHGLSYTLNRGITEYAKGKYITFCASDDYWLPGKLVKQVKYLENNSEIPMVYGKSRIIDFDGNFLEQQTLNKNQNLKGGLIFKEILLQEFHRPVNYMYRAEIFKETGIFDTHAWVEDFDMNLKISEIHPIGYLDDYLTCYRIGRNSGFANNPVRIVESHRHSIDKYKDSPFYKEALIRWYYRNFIWFSSRSKNELFAFKSMLCSLQYCYKKQYLKGIRNLVLRWQYKMFNMVPQLFDNSSTLYSD